SWAGHRTRGACVIIGSATRHGDAQRASGLGDLLMQQYVARPAGGTGAFTRSQRHVVRVLYLQEEENPPETNGTRACLRRMCAVCSAWQGPLEPIDAPVQICEPAARSLAPFLQLSLLQLQAIRVARGSGRAAAAGIFRIGFEFPALGGTARRGGVIDVAMQGFVEALQLSPQVPDIPDGELTEVVNV